MYTGQRHNKRVIINSHNSYHPRPRRTENNAEVPKIFPFHTVSSPPLPHSERVLLSATDGSAERWQEAADRSGAAPLGKSMRVDDSAKGAEVGVQRRTSGELGGLRLSTAFERMQGKIRA
ncbi:hypothetical protein SKAU_G00165290 [Synaphobranchus kaupii]|uniref:Uncharacterized protein n=1 Tax=Synaphobranchus kaupii TaxID=118154 RepID=A0A9Q1FJB6_SYNKA|nr:hypothetical protein SKAU_G00165290 [Synaphobranchus kaupii]